MQEYIVKIKEPNYDNLMLSPGGVDLSSYSTLDEAFRKMASLQKDLEDEYQKCVLRIINDVIISGGIVLLDKKELNYEWSIFKTEIRIKIPEDKISFIEKNSQVEYIIKE